jgi:NaMN:DMB phosphoribosyltransferase
MHLGEGTGAALGFTLVDLATRLVREMGTLDDAGFDIYVPRTDGEG